MDPLRAHVLAQLRGGSAYDTFDAVIAEFAFEERFIIPTGAERSPWQILEHLRISLRDILDFTQNEDGSYVEREWPREYWPADDGAGPEAWDLTISEYKSGIEEMERLVQDPVRDLFAPFQWVPGRRYFVKHYSPQTTPDITSDSSSNCIGGSKRHGDDNPEVQGQPQLKSLGIAAGVLQPNSEP